MMKKNVLIMFVLIISPLSLWGQSSMRRCLLLPITDYVKDAVSYKIYENVERYLKNSEICRYQSNSAIMDILSNYKNNLSVHLENKSVLKIISEKTRAGSMIKIDIKNDLKGVVVGIKIFGANGEDIYLKEKASLNSDDVYLISQTIKNWMNVFDKIIPYDGKIIGILGNQFVVDFGKMTGIKTLSNIKVMRPVGKKKHPLLKEIVAWDTKEVATAKLFHITDYQSQGKVQRYNSSGHLRIGDWVSLTDGSQVEKIENEVISDQNTFGRLGRVNLYAILGAGSESVLKSTGDTNKIGGLLVGAEVSAEIWATRSILAMVRISKKTGSYSQKEGDNNIKSNSASISNFDILFGYRFLPLGFFYGPRVDIYGGYGKNSYDIDNSVDEGIVGASYSGLKLGVRGSIPLRKLFRAFIDLDFKISPNYKENADVYGSADSVSSYRIEVGGEYVYKPRMNILGSIGTISNSAKFKTPVGENKFNETYLKGGVSFTF